MKMLGSVLIVDLSTGKIGIEPFPIEWVSQYIGGRGINSYLLYKDLKKKIRNYIP